MGQLTAPGRSLRYYGLVCVSLRPGKRDKWVREPRIHETDYYVFSMAGHLRVAAEPTKTRASATRATATQPGLAQPHSSPRPTFSTACRLPARTHGAAQPPRRQQPQLARAPAGHRSPTGSRGFCPPVRHPPPLQPPSPRPMVHAGSVKPTDALKSCSTAAFLPHLGPGSAPSGANRHHRLRTPAAQRRRGRCRPLC